MKQSSGKTAPAKGWSRLTKAQLIEQLEASEHRNQSLEQEITDLRVEKSANPIHAPAIQQLIDKANQGILVHRHRQPLYANQSLADMYGYDTPEEIMALENTAALTAPSFENDTHQTRLDGAPLAEDHESMGARKNGEHFWENRRSFLVDWDGKPAVCSMRFDISERKQAEEEFLANEARFRTLTDNSNQGIVVVRHYKFLYANQAFADMYGYDSIEEVLALDSTQKLKSPNHPDPALYHEAHLRGEDIPLDREVLAIRKDGTEFWINRRGFLIDWDGEVAVCNIRVDISDRKQSEEALRQSHEALEERVAIRTRELSESDARFRGAIASLQEGFSLWDADDRLVIANEAYRQSLHIPSEIVVPGLLFEDLMRAIVETGDLPEAMGREEEYIEHRMQLHKHPSGPVVREFSDGTTFVTVERRTPDGGTVLTRNGITERRRAEKILSAAIESIPDGITLYDPDDRLVLFNQNFVKGRQELVKIFRKGRTFEEINRECESMALRNSRMDGGKITLEERIERHRNPKGPHFSVNPDGRVMQVNEIKTPDGYTAVIRTDISALKKTEEALRESEQQFRAIVEGAPMAVMLKDTNGQILINNKIHAEWTNTTSTGIDGQTVYDFFPKKEADDVTARDQAAINSKQNSVAEITRECADGVTRTVLAHRCPIIAPSGEVTSLLTILADISEQKQMLDELLNAKIGAEAANAAKSQFLATMSHELRTPLNAILGFAHLIGQEIFGSVNEKYREYANDIENAGTHLLTMVNDILDLSAIEAGNQTVDKERLSIMDAFDESKRIVGREMNDKGVDLTITPLNGATHLYADKQAVRQILLNLLSNALKFTNNGDTVTLSAQESAATTCITVADTGIGISEDDIPGLTEPFMRTKANAYHAEKGWGLGLAITKTLVELHSGDLQIDSTLGQGTTITVIFPTTSH